MLASWLDGSYHEIAMVGKVNYIFAYLQYRDTFQYYMQFRSGTFTTLGTGVEHEY